MLSNVVVFPSPDGAVSFHPPQPNAGVAISSGKVETKSVNLFIMIFKIVIRAFEKFEFRNAFEF